MKPLLLLFLLVSAGYSAPLTPTPNKNLPKHINPTPNQPLSLIADFKNKTETSIPLYLINTSKKEIQLPTQDDDLYIKLEILTSEKTWQRAQNHSNSFCGNSYYPKTLPAGHHFKVNGYQPKNGKPAQIRFTIYNQQNPLSTQSHPGLYLPSDLEKASTDAMSVQKIPHTLHRFNLPFNDDYNEKILLNIASNQNSTTELKEALILWKQFGPIPRNQKSITNLLEAISTTKNPTLKTLQKEIQTLANLPFHPKASPTQLADFCFQELNKKNNAILPDTLWNTLAQLSLYNLVPQKLQSKILTACLENQPRHLLSHPKLRATIKDDQLWKLLERHNEFHLTDNIYQELITRELKPHAIEKALTLDPAHAQSLIRTIAYSTKPKNPVSLSEQKLYLKAFTENPTQTASYISSDHRFSLAPESFNFLAKPSISYINQELKKSNTADKDYKLDGYLNYWLNLTELTFKLNPNLPDPFFQNLAKHRGYTINQYSTGTPMLDIVEHEYPFRHVAQRTLKARSIDITNLPPTKIHISSEPTKHPQ